MRHSLMSAHEVPSPLVSMNPSGQVQAAGSPGSFVQTAYSSHASRSAEVQPGSADALLTMMRTEQKDGLTVPSGLT
eukprot:326143-Rhodomonas_salina.1